MHSKRLATLACLLIASGGLSSAVSASGVGASAELFSAGRSHMSLVVSSGSAFNDTYVVIGIGAGYHVADGLAVKLNAELWTGGSTDITKISPAIQYAFVQSSSVTPYLGAFFTRTWIEQQPDLDSAGLRAGGYLAVGKQSFLGAGVVYESYLDCNTTVFVSCDEWYPEFSFVIGF